MIRTTKLLPAAIIFGAALAAQAQDTVHNEPDRHFDQQAQSTLDRATVARGAREAVARGAFHNEPDRNFDQQAPSSANRAKVHAEAIYAARHDQLPRSEN